jgi:Cryptococcal mannosyltransferase 1
VIANKSQTEDIVTLLSTRDGYYDAVCSLDFSVPLIYYDTFALRDSLGAKAFPQMWPYFMSPASRDALISNGPVPVQSCWNGVVAFQAEPFYASPPLRFRGISDSLAKHHLEGSECCLIHADFHRATSHGVWLNPNVRVGYKPEAYHAVNPPDGRIWPTWYKKVGGMWLNRVARWVGWMRRKTEKWHVESEVRQWESEAEGNHEEALHCLINEMQVLYQNGWLHV